MHFSSQVIYYVIQVCFFFSPNRKVDISFPKFKLEQKYKLKKLLHALGIKNLFTRMADLGHLTDQGYVAVSQVSLLKLFAIWIIIVYKQLSQETVS